MPYKRCLTCQQLYHFDATESTGRCPEHRKTKARGYSGLWQRLPRNLPCQQCGHPPGDRDNPITYDHIIPKIQGGSDDPSNLQILCKKCNSIKGKKNAKARNRNTQTET